jgi:hypothetical protein
MSEHSAEKDAGLHTVTIEFDANGFGPSLKFECHAPETADCRNACHRSECEEGCYHPDHPREPLGFYNNVEWFTNGDDVETWIAGDTTSVTVPVEVSWQNTRYDGPEWRFGTRVTPPGEGRA